ncbi:MAG: nucleotidyltransferase family protein [Cyanobacteria bacterium Co-bin8]|nr:nucleotidyltransferase family protein [Cyanobacteria bacterium Co-bin8]
MSRVGILILAAGASTRLGQPKQLLNFQGRPLIRHIAEVAASTGHQPAGVVLGAHAAAIQPHLAPLAVHIINNPDWQSGMASSLCYGLRQILCQFLDLDAVILMVCDQPLVTPALLHQLILGHQTSHCPIVASAYSGTLGVPALFHQTFFSKLLTLAGDAGARSIIEQHRALCLGIPFTGGAMDLDTPQDLEILAS